MIDPQIERDLKGLAAQLTMKMLDNHSADWDDKQTAAAFRTIYTAVRDA